MKTYVGCFCSALLGGLFAVWMMQDGPMGNALAQVDPIPGAPDANQGPNFPNPLRTEDAPVKPRAVPGGEFNAEGLTNEEAVNVAVYENCNRSVVNITTQSLRGDG